MALPGLHEEDTDHLAEELADFGRRGKIACRAKGLTRLVVSELRVGEAEREVIGDADRSARGDQGLDFFCERRAHRAPPQVAVAAARRARKIAQSPANA